MSDSDGGWDDDDFEVPDLTKATLNATTRVVEDKFADEDAESAAERAAREAKERETAAARAKTAARKKVSEIKTSVVYDDEALDDPVAEKARRQKLVEEADLRAARELFGGEEELKLDEFVPKGKGDFEKLGSAIAHKYLAKHGETAHYVEALKALLRVALRDASAADVKEVEVAVVAARTDKVKKEKADAEAAKKAAANSKKGKFLNAGAKGGDSGLDDYKYNVSSVDDEYDFM